MPNKKIIIGDLAKGEAHVAARDQLLKLQLEYPARFINLELRPIPFACAALKHEAAQQREWREKPGPV